MHDLSRKAITLVVGGVRSGKSRYAQTLAAGVAPVAFVATARSSDSDEEMRRKIERHQTDRPQDWKTIEEPLDLASVLAEQGPNYRIIVVDCLTLYAANLLQAEHGNLLAVEERLQRAASGGCVQDRRKYKRIPMCAQVTCVMDARTSRGVSRNLSRDGMRLEGADFKIAESVQLTFRLDAHAIVDAVGTVVWAAERRHGIRFAYMGAQSQRSVRQFILDHSGH